MILRLDKICIFFCIIMVTLFLTSCVSISVQEDDFQQYSREDVATMELSESFGEKRLDEVYVALSYIYNDKSIQEQCGSDFEILEENVIRNSGENRCFFFYWLFKGNAEYTIIIGEHSYTLKLSKTYFGKWKVETVNHNQV